MTWRASPSERERGTSSSGRDDIMTAVSIEPIGPLRLTDEDRMATEGYPWEEWDRLRRDAPVLWYEPPGDYEPFWSISRHADILTISKRSDVFVSRQRLRLFPRAIETHMNASREALEAQFGPANGAPLSFNDMDAPHHLKYRNLTSRYFTPRAMRAFEGKIASLATDHVSRFARRLAKVDGGNAPLDLVHDLAVKVPTAAIFQMLGVPPEQHSELFTLWESNMRLSPEERERQADQDIATVFFNPDGEGQRYLARMIDDARERGASADDLLAALLDARVDGEQLPQQALVAYVMLLIAAGLDTTRHATTGGVHLLLEHPDQLARLVADSSLIDSAVGDPSLHVPRHPLLPHGGRRLRDRRADDSRRRVREPVVPVGQPRRRSLRSALRIRHCPRPEPTPRVRRLRPALLHRRTFRTHPAPGRLPGAAAALAAARSRRRSRPHAEPTRRGVYRLTDPASEGRLARRRLPPFRCELEVTIPNPFLSHGLIGSAVTPHSAWIRTGAPSRRLKRADAHFLGLIPNMPQEHS